MAKAVVTVGMDDIDSPSGGCTTHFASLLVEHLAGVVTEWLDYPKLIRLNPNIPYRTRGNGAVALQFTMDSSEIDNILPAITQMIVDYADTQYPNTNPGLVLNVGKVPSLLSDFAKRALWRTIPVSLAIRLISKLDLPFYARGNMRGTIGALAAIGHSLDDDHTYEYIAYRRLEDGHDPRGVVAKSVIEMNKATLGKTFGNLDSSTNGILIEPQGPDPVLYGIRGNSAIDIVEAASMVRSRQAVERWMIFRTNQGTGEHLSHQMTISEIRPYMSVSVLCRVKEPAKILEGGHVLFSVEDDTGIIDCAAYEPTGDFRWVVTNLVPGDRILAHAGVRPASRTHGLTLNLEGMHVLELANKIEEKNPLCTECGRRMKSAGKNKGFKCVSCGYKATALQKEKVLLERNLEIGIYLPREGAQRHLTRPEIRFGIRNELLNGMIAKWHHP